MVGCDQLLTINVSHYNSKTMNNKYIYLFLFSLLFSCKADRESLLDLDYKIDKVVCQSNSNYFIADGVSEIGLEVKLYTTAGSYTAVNGKQQLIYKEIPQERWKHHIIKFYDKSGKEYPANFTTTSIPAEKMEFYAEVDGLRSSKPVLLEQAENPLQGTPISPVSDPYFYEVSIRSARPTPALKRYPIIFHVIDTEQSKKQSQELNADAIYYVLNQYNAIFSKQNNKASNGANAHIEFVAALKDPNGKLLKEAGINRTYLTDQQNLNLSTEYILNSPSLYWDYDKYLNVWIINNSKWYSLAEIDLYRRALPFTFREGTYNSQKLPLPDFLPVQSLNASQLANWKKKPDYLDHVGLVFVRTGFSQLKHDFVGQPAAFLGVIPNRPANGNSTQLNNGKWVDDYCEDTPTFNPYYASTANGGIERLDFGSTRKKYTAKIALDGKTGSPAFPWITYNSQNVGEKNSFSSTITQDQAQRIEWTLNHAEARQAWRNQTAITP